MRERVRGLVRRHIVADDPRPDLDPEAIRMRAAIQRMTKRPINFQALAHLSYDLYNHGNDPRRVSPCTIDELIGTEIVEVDRG